MDMSKVVYSDKPMTLGHRILLQRAGQSDWEALASYIVVRTNLTPVEAMTLDDDECSVIIEKSVKASQVLENLGKSLPKIDV